MQDKASTLTETEDDKDALPRLGPLTKEESQALRQFWEEIIESLEDWTEEEMVAFDSTLRHPPSPEKSEEQQ